MDISKQATQNVKQVQEVHPDLDESPMTSLFALGPPRPAHVSATRSVSGCVGKFSRLKRVIIWTQGDRRESQIRGMNARPGFRSVRLPRPRSTRWNAENASELWEYSQIGASESSEMRLHLGTLHRWQTMHEGDPRIGCEFRENS